MKKFLATILSIALIISVLPLGSFVAVAADDFGTEADGITVSSKTAMDTWTATEGLQNGDFTEGLKYWGPSNYYGSTAVDAKTSDIVDLVTEGENKYVMFNGNLSYVNAGFQSVPVKVSENKLEAGDTLAVMYKGDATPENASAKVYLRQFNVEGDKDDIIATAAVNLQIYKAIDSTWAVLTSANGTVLENATASDYYTFAVEFRATKKTSTARFDDVKIVKVKDGEFYTLDGLPIDSNGDPSEHFNDGVLTYILSNGGAKIIDCDNSVSGNFIIPNNLGGYPVVSIGAYAFSDCVGLTSITIPDSVTKIGEAAFYGCIGLESITLPFVGSRRTAYMTYDAVFGYIFGFTSTYETGTTEQYYKPGSRSYYYIPSKLKTVTITDATQIPYGSFYNCTGLTSITVANSVTSIGSGAFKNCIGLLKIIIPDSVINIGNDAFYNCTSLTSVVIPNSVASIEDRAFYYCSKLTSITIPKSVTNIGTEAFFSCTNIVEVWYTGSKNDKSEIVIGSYNENLTNIIWHFTQGKEVDLKPTCTKNGVEVVKCTECGEKREWYIDALGHDFGEWEVDTESTCTTNGLEIRQCIVCGEKTERIIAAKGHTFGDWKTEIKPTCAHIGLKVKICSVCGDRQEQILPIVDHSYSVYIEVNTATCTQNGKRTLKCTWCHKRITTETTSGHIYKDGKCVFCEDSAEIVESTHNYDRNTNQTWSVTKENASALDVTFSEQTETETKYDFIYIYDGGDNLIGEYSGTELAGQTITVSGDTVKITLTSDTSIVKYGFYATITPVDTVTIAGDTNDDGAVNALDMLNIQDAILTGAKTAAYDITGDGLVNLLDLVRIKKILAGKA